MARPETVRRVKSHSAANGYGYQYQYYFYEVNGIEENGAAAGEFMSLIAKQSNLEDLLQSVNI